VILKIVPLLFENRFYWKQVKKMADLVEHMGVEEHPVRDPRVAPQRPYAADPGTLTSWFEKNTLGASNDEMLRILAVTNAKYANVAANEERQEVALAILKELAEDILAAEPLEAFLTEMVPEGGRPTVIVVSRLSRYRPELGQVSAWTGQVFGFLGEVEEGQLPPLMKLPDALLLRQALAPRDVVAPTWAEWNAHDGVGPDRIPIMGEDLMSADGNDGSGRTVFVARLQYIPRAWASYFLGGVTPEKAMRVIRLLIESLDTDVQRAIAAPIERWCAAACTRSGIVGALRIRSKVQIAWVSPAAALDRSLGRWGARKMAPYTTVAMPVAAAFPGGVMGAVPGMAGAVPFPLAPAYEPLKDKCFSPFEHERIRLACGLGPANYDLGRPLVYAAMLAEGRTLPKVEAVLQRFLAPPPGDWDPIRIYVSAELVRDMKDLKFGWSNENTYDTCHRGISPFAVLQVSMELQNKRRKIQERADRATYLSTDDVRSMEAEPGACPQSYYGMLNLIRRYIRLLTVLFGPGCVHLLEVQGVYQVLSDKSGVYETMGGELVAETLWQLFIDAREYFSQTGPELPVSQLFALRDSIRSCTLKETINCPVDRLLGRPSSSVALVSQTASGGVSRGSRGSSGGSSMSTLTARASAAGSAVAGAKRTNPAPIPEIVTIMSAFREKRPGVDMVTLMRSQKLLMADIGIGGRGQCMDFMYFGECGRSGCTYAHGPARVSPGKRRDIVKKMTKAVAGFLAEDAEA
jgi:hypothetical protein